MAIIRNSSGAVLFPNVTTRAARTVVEATHGQTTTPGDKTFVDVKTFPAKDALYTAASSANPVVVGISNVHFVSVKVPEQ